MNFLIVEQAPDSTPHLNPLYRGISRLGPLHCYALPPDTEINQLGRWYMDEDLKGYLHNLEKSRRFIELLHQFDPKQKYELIEVVDGIDKPNVGNVFLGFDVVAEGNSLIQWGLKSFVSSLDVPEPIRDLAGLIDFTFAPHLNAQGLFQEFEVASYCLQSMVAIQSLHANFYEGCDLGRFRVVDVYLVEP
jgi:hypothetical protein